MNKIVIDSGLEEFEVADKYGKVYGVVRFNPSDLNLLDRYEKVAQDFEHLTDGISEDEEIESAKAKCEARVYELIDYLFGAPVSAVFFAVASPFSPLASGDLYVESVISALGDKIEQYTGTRVDKVQAKVNKYAAKYQRNGKIDRQAMIDEFKQRNGNG